MSQPPRDSITMRPVLGRQKAELDRPRCFYCGDPVIPSRVERDHFPIPECAGGKQTVTACPQCHDLKDRTNWRDLTPTMKGAFMEDFLGMGRAGRIVVAQLLRAVYEMSVTRAKPAAKKRKRRARK